MKKENFLDLLQRDNPKEILEYIKRHGKKQHSIDPLIFYKDTKDGEDKPILN